MMNRPFNSSKPPCFKEGTLVKTPTGDVTIESIQEGSLVFAFDLINKVKVIRPVVNVHRNWTDYWVDIQVEDEKITSTLSHLYWENELNEWTTAQELMIGSILRRIDGKNIGIQSKRMYSTESATYNIEVGEHNNYFVGYLGVLVHNESGWESTQKKPTVIYKIVNQITGETVYIGKSYQNGGDAKTRFKQHLYETQRGDKWNGLKGTLKVHIIEGPKNWTRFEAAVWEQYHINKHGGAVSQNNGVRKNLWNKIRAIAENSYNEYRKSKYGHKPCN
jgi:hypothetical protein